MMEVNWARRRYCPDRLLPGYDPFSPLADLLLLLRPTPAMIHDAVS